MSNIYEKIQKIRCELQNMNIKKSGENKFSKYTYYELSDFLPHINDLLMKNKLFSNVSFGETAVLEIINSEKPDEKVNFVSPMATANLKGCHDVQNLGAVQTYLRRYLYINAFEISESDGLEPTIGETSNKPDKKTDTKTSTLITTEQAKRLFAISQGNTNLVKSTCEKYNYKSSKDITKVDYENIAAEIEMEVKK